MVRKLPWKHEAATRTPKDKRKLKGTADLDQADGTHRSQQDFAEKDDTRKSASDDSDDENYRITESEFVDTARYFTRDLHQQAYERLVQQQQKEAESKNTLSDLLEQPVLPYEAVSVPPSRAIAPKAKSTDASVTINRKPQVRPPESSHPLSVVPLQVPQKEERPVPLSNTKVENIQDNTVKSDSGPKPTTVTKLSDAAAARRRKRQQAQKAEVVMGRFV